MAVVTELVTKFTFSGDTSPLGKYNEQLGGAIMGLAKMGTALVAVFAAINAFVVTTLAGADAQGQLAINTGVSVEALQELGFIASVSGSSTEALNSSVANLSQTIGDAAQKGNEDFARLGISVRDANGQVKTADTIMGELGGRFKALGLSLQEQQGFAQALGLDSSLVQLLNRSGAEMDTLRKRARSFGLVTADQQTEILAFNDSLTTLRFGLSAVGRQIAIGLSPTIKSVTDDFTDWLAAHKDLLVNGLTAVGDGVNVMMDAINRLKFVIVGAIALFVAFKIATIGLGAVLGAVFSPVVLITAGIIALLIIIDDLIVAMNGGQSVIRDFFLEFFGWDIVPYIQGIIDAFKAFGKVISLIWKATISLWTGDFDGFIAHIRDLFTAVAEYISLVFAPVLGVIDKVQGFLGFGDPGGTTNNSVAQNVTIEINTNDAGAAGTAVADSLQGQLANANTQFNRGGR